MKSLNTLFSNDPVRFAVWTLVFIALIFSVGVLKHSNSQLANVYQAQTLTTGPESSSETYGGELEVIILDNFEELSYVDTYEYFIRDSKGQRKKLDVSKLKVKPVDEFKSGDIVRVKGAENKKKEIEVTQIELGSTAAETATDYQAITASGEVPVTDERRVVTLLVDFEDMSQGGTVSSVTSLLYTGAQNVNDLYRTASRGYVGLNPDTDGNGTHDVFGPFKISSVSSTSTCDFATWSDQANSLATQAGIDLGKYQHRLYVVPKNPGCPFSGVAFVGCGTYCNAWVLRSSLPDLIAHELGHNLGMSHAGTDPENDGIINGAYSDITDPMGFSGQPLRFFNAANDSKNGWSGSFPQKEFVVSSGGEFTIAPLTAEPSLSPYPQILKIPKKGSATEYYYISYRKAEGYDGKLSATYTSGASIHRAVGTKGGATALIKNLSSADPVWADPLGSGLSVTQLEKAADSSYIRVFVQYGETACIGKQPTLSLTPTTQAIKNANGGYSFTAYVKNNDSFCNATILKPILTNTTLSGTFAPENVSIESGANKSFTLDVSAPNTSGKIPFSVTLSDVDGVDPVHTDVTVVGEVVVDTQPPSTPTLSGAHDVEQGSIHLSWTSSTDDIAVSRYELLRDGYIRASVVNTLTFVDTPSLGTYSYTVRALDAANNMSAQSNSQTFTISSKVETDTQSPTPPVLTATQNTKQGTVSLSWSGSTDNVGVTGYDVLRNGAVITSVTAQNYVDKPTTAGTYTYTVRARDAAGNVSQGSNQTAITIKTKGQGRPR